MEPSSKRRRLSPRHGHSTEASHLCNNEMASDDTEGSEPRRPLLNSRFYGSSISPKLFAEHVPRSPKGLSSRNGKLSALHPRNLVPTRAAGAVQSPAQTVIASVVQVVVNDGNGGQVTELLVPVETSVISIEGFVPITLGSEPKPTSLPNDPGYQTSSPMPPAAFPSKPTQTIHVQAFPSSNAASSDPQASSRPMSISITGAQSQAVLSSPPSTPLPSSPSPSPSPTSTGSYFASSTGGAPASNSAQAAAATQMANTSLSPGSDGGNSTVTSKRSSDFSITVQLAKNPSLGNPSTTTIGTSMLNLNSAATSDNSTMVTPTRSNSSEISGASSTPSMTSANVTSSIASSSTGSATSSQAQSSSSSFLDIPTSSLSPSSTGGVTGGGVGDPGGTSGTASAPSSTAGAGAASSDSGTPTTPAVVGGVVGGVAGLALVLLLLLFLLRRRRARTRQRQISPSVPQTLPPAAGTGATTERSSVVPFAAGAFIRRLRPGSGQTAATTDTAPSERGFQNMGGRKLESVLSSRGDGYSDPVPASGVPPRNYGGTAAGLGLAAGVAQPGASGGAGEGPSPGPSEDDTLSGSSFYRDSHGFYGGHEGEAGPSGLSSTSPISTAPAVGGPALHGGGGPGNSEREIAVTRPSPARTPVINQPGYATFRQPPGTGRGTPPPDASRGTPPPRTLTPEPRQQDDVGRSHPSFDGSRGSRFAEEL